MFRLVLILFLNVKFVFPKCNELIKEMENSLCTFKFYHKLDDEQQNKFASIFNNKTISLADMDEQLEEWAETLPDRAQAAYDTFWDQIWDIIDEFRDYGYKIRVSDIASPYVENFMDTISDDDISKHEFYHAMHLLERVPHDEIKSELLLFRRKLLDHIKPKVLKLMLPKIASHFRDKHFTL